jgi:hypothetical protein
MNIARKTLPALLVATSISLGGCATVLKSKTTSLPIEDASAVTVDGRPVEGPTVTLSNKTGHTITYRNASGETASCQVHSKASTGWVIASILAGGVGWIIDLATHNWNNLDTRGCQLTGAGGSTASR